VDALAVCFYYAVFVQAMESKLLCGGKNIVDHTNEQQRALEQRRQEIAEQQVCRLFHIIFISYFNYPSTHIVM